MDEQHVSSLSGVGERRLRKNPGTVLRPLAELARDPLVLAMNVGVVAFAMLTFLLAVALFSQASLWLLGLSMAVPTMVQTAFGTAASFGADHAPKRVLYSAGLLTIVPAAILGGFVASNEQASLIVLPLAYFIASAGISIGLSVANVLTPLRFSDSQLSTVNSINMALASIGFAVGPLLAAVIGGYSKPAAYGVAAAAGALAAALALRAGERPAVSSHKGAMPSLSASAPVANEPAMAPVDGVPVVSSDEKVGVFCILMRSRMLLLITIGLSLTWLGVAGVNAVEVPFIIDDLGGGEAGYAFLLSWTAGWGLIFSMLYAIASTRVPAAHAYFGGTVLMSVGWIAFALSPNLIIAAIAVVITAGAGVAVNVGSSALMQALTRNEPRIGGVLGVISGTFHIAAGLSLVAAAAAAEWLASTRTVLVVEGLLAAVAIPFVLRLLRAMPKDMRV